jgi:hypothetical protein
LGSRAAVLRTRADRPQRFQYPTTCCTAAHRGAAIAANLAARPDSEHGQRMRAAFGLNNGPANPADCVDLDAQVHGLAEPSSPPAPQRPPLPEGMVETIGTPRRATISVNRV